MKQFWWGPATLYACVVVIAGVFVALAAMFILTSG